ncbi:MAG TPA: tRNA guanosine(34) transglycosylase Tgt [Phycisphaerales bacterium]|nr:tRNA guanosine(34) transglycosylase Tgt [Phycisphaerales bacterium]
MSALRFEISARCSVSRARVGRVTTVHGAFETPAFMPVGTQGTVKGLLPQMVAGTGSRIILGNTYHLMLRPGEELVARLGGLHSFMGWPGPILTDSGGYQAYSMSDLTKLTDDSVTFRSVVDGSMVELTPERAIAVQNKLGADIIMALDDCPPSVDPATLNQTRLRLKAQQSVRRRGYDHAKRLDEANERTIRWLERCKRAHARAEAQSLFGIVQGGTDLERRTWSAERVSGVELPGYAIGGVAVGEGFEEIVRVVEHTAKLLPEEKPRYLMGVGYERDIVAAVRAGVDMFDCVLPTRNGRNAFAFTRTGVVRLRNARYTDDAGPIEEGCDCFACAPGKHGWVFPGAMGDVNAPTGSKQPVGGTGDARLSAEPDSRGTGERRGDRVGHFSRAYLRHLFMAGEMLGPILVSLHNVRHFQGLMVDIRAAIRENGWSALGRQWPVAREALPASPEMAEG